MGATKRVFTRPKRKTETSPKTRPAMVSMGVRTVKIDPVIQLLIELRAHPTEDSIRKIVAFVDHERADYFHLRKAVEKAIARPLTEAEQKLTEQLQ